MYIFEFWKVKTLVVRRIRKRGTDILHHDAVHIQGTEPIMRINKHTGI